MDHRRETPLLDAATDAIVITDEHGRIDMFNEAAERMFGYRSADMIGGDVERLVPPPADTTGERAAHRLIDAGIAAGGREIRARRASGEVFPAWFSIGEARDAGRRRFIAIFRDLSEQHAAAARARALEARLAQLDSAYLVGELGSAIAHEMNQPLSAIATYAQAARRMIAAGAPDFGVLEDACRSIDEQARRAGRLLRNFRSVVRPPEPRLEALDVNALVAEIMPLIGAEAAAEGVDVALEHGPALPPVHGDVIQLQGLLLSLARNSIDAMRDMPRDNRRLRIRTASGAAGVHISVADTGSGVSPALADHVFEPFVTTKKDRLGFGLATCRAIAAVHGGRIAHEPGVGEDTGACFTITLPTHIEAEMTG